MSADQTSPKNFLRLFAIGSCRVNWVAEILHKNFPVAGHSALIRTHTTGEALAVVDAMQSRRLAALVERYGIPWLHGRFNHVLDDGRLLDRPEAARLRAIADDLFPALCDHLAAADIILIEISTLRRQAGRDEDISQAQLEADIAAISRRLAPRPILFVPHLTLPTPEVDAIPRRARLSDGLQAAAAAAEQHFFAIGDLLAERAAGIGLLVDLNHYSQAGAFLATSYYYAKLVEIALTEGLELHLETNNQALRGLEADTD